VERHYLLGECNARFGLKPGRAAPQGVLRRSEKPLFFVRFWAQHHFREGAGVAGSAARTFAGSMQKPG
jgi:hypothetical protein